MTDTIEWRLGGSKRLIAGAPEVVDVLQKCRFKGVAAIVRYLTWIKVKSQIQPPTANMLYNHDIFSLAVLVTAKTATCGASG